MQRAVFPALSSETTNHNLKLYSLAAAAAGVSLLALGQSANGEVVVTKKQIQILSHTFIDLNHDGISDFEFSASNFYASGLNHFTMNVKALTGGKVVGEKKYSKGFYASALMRGVDIGPSAHFANPAQVTVERQVRCSCPSAGYYGNWSYYAGNNRYLGVKFLIKGETHYGWIKMKTSEALPGPIVGYAYETIANKKITAGATTDIAVAKTELPESTTGLKDSGPSLGMLARGTDGIALWRREDQSSAPTTATPIA